MDFIRQPDGRVWKTNMECSVGKKVRLLQYLSCCCIFFVKNVNETILLPHIIGNKLCLRWLYVGRERWAGTHISSSASGLIDPGPQATGPLILSDYYTPDWLYSWLAAGCTPDWWLAVHLTGGWLYPWLVVPLTGGWLYPWLLADAIILIIQPPDQDGLYQSGNFFICVLHMQLPYTHDNSNRGRRGERELEAEREREIFDKWCSHCCSLLQYLHTVYMLYIYHHELIS